MITTQKIQIVQPIYEESYSIKAKSELVQDEPFGSHCFFFNEIRHIKYFIKTELTNTGKVSIVHQDEVFPAILKVGSKFNLGTPCEPNIVTLNSEYVESDGTITFTTLELIRVGCPTALFNLTTEMVAKQIQEDKRVSVLRAKRRRDIEQIDEEKRQKEAAQRALTDRERARISKLQGKIKEMEQEIRSIRKY